MPKRNKRGPASALASQVENKRSRKERDDVEAINTVREAEAAFGNMASSVQPGTSAESEGTCVQMVDVDLNLDLNLAPQLDNVPMILTPSAHNQISCQVSLQVREKIIAGRFIDLGTLLNFSESQQDNRMIGLDPNGGLVLKGQHSGPKISDIGSWTDAMLVFSSIYLSANPDKAQELLKYISNVRLGAKQYGGLGWRSYDQQFRLRLAADPVSRSFDKIDYELWLLYMSAPYQSQSVPQASKLAQKRCFDYNFRQCNKSRCIYRHVCLNCNGDHPSRSCGSGRRGQQATDPMSQQKPKGQNQYWQRGPQYGQNPRPYFQK